MNDTRDEYDEDLDEEERPWEKRGARRLDAEPHRGRLIQGLGWASLALAVTAFVTGITGVPGGVLGLTALVMAHRDLARMRQGLMDRRGEKRTRQGGDAGLVGALLSLLATAVWIGVFFDRFFPFTAGGP